MAITLYPWIIATKNEKKDKVLMNHENIHLIQEKELFVLPFYLLYIGYSIYLFVRYLNIGSAYILNRFEAEAYANEGNMDYLKTRKKFAWIKPDATILAYEENMKKRKVLWTERAMAIFILSFIIVVMLSLIFFKN